MYQAASVVIKEAQILTLQVTTFLQLDAYHGFSHLFQQLGASTEPKEIAMNLVQSILSIIKKQSCSCEQMYFISRRCVHGTCKVLSSEKNTDKNEIEDSPSIDDMSEPTNCCMSGCANCVWIQYAEKLSATLEKSDVDLQKMIIEKVQDPNMRAFLSMELRCRNMIK